MKKYTPEELAQILALHGQWLRYESGCVRADLSYANLSYADLSYANLSYANLSYADLSYANLSSADLSSADLSSANLSYANLSSADLSSADLSSANLSYANLSYAKVGDLYVLRSPIHVHGTRYSVVETWEGISIGCEKSVTSENLESLFDEHKTPEQFRELYRTSVKMIEARREKYPLLGEKP